jgi:sulfate transport system substrate-binding protein
MLKARLHRLAVLPLAIICAVAGLATISGASSTTTVNVVGYSVVSAAYSALEKAFQATPAGQNVTFTNSFGPSGTQAQDVVAGQPADIVNLSLEPDMQSVVSGGLVSNNWSSTPMVKNESGMVTDSTIVIVVDPGNPLGITGWNNLTKGGVKLVTPDPISSGSAKWNLLAAYESQILQGRSVKHAKAYLNALIGRVVSEPSSGSKALSTFLEGTGNVLLAYESDALTALAAGSKIQIIYPAQNLLIENPAALTTTGLAKPAAVAFFQYLFSVPGQTIFIAQHYRSTLSVFQREVKNQFYTPSSLTTVTRMGGWTKVWNKFFATNGLVTQDEFAHGYTS